MGFTGTPAAERTEAEIRRRFPGMFDSIGQYNRRKISGSTSWSQHSWGNALDIMVGGSLNSGTPEGYRRGDIMYAFLSANKTALGIRYILWRRYNHHNHIHVDFWPKGVYTPPLSSTGIGSFKYSNGKVVSTRIQLVPAQGNWQWDPTEEINVLKRGDSGKAVKRYQGALLKWNSNALPEWKDDGDFGAETEAWVIKFQAAEDLPQSGVIDGVTADSLSRFTVVAGTVDGTARQTAADAKALALTNQSKIASASKALS